ncbi:hypothetical protein, partial [Intrasporangium chromatireducens]|uniref:hypothetical protein n=1 Tax=Intrasporangium chromatireducens TaxID=1386088 RepID=UPI00196A18D1
PLVGWWPLDGSHVERPVPDTMDGAPKRVANEMAGAPPTAVASMTPMQPQVQTTTPDPSGDAMLH